MLLVGVTIWMSSCVSVKAMENEKLGTDATANCFITQEVEEIVTLETDTVPAEALEEDKAFWSTF